MSGHSKWSTIKHKKAAADAKRGKVFGHISKMIRIAVKEANTGDPDQNPALRVALDKARSANMPKRNIDRAIAKGLGKSADGASFDQVLYEGFGPGGVAVMIDVVTDNRNRTAAEIRNILEKHGGSMGGPGAVGYMFERSLNGEYSIKVPLPITDAKAVSAVEDLVDTLESHDDVEAVVCNMVNQTQ